MSVSPAKSSFSVEKLCKFIDNSAIRDELAVHDVGVTPLISTIRFKFFCIIMENWI